MMRVPSRRSTVERRVQADVSLSDSVEDFTNKTPFLPEPPYIVPSQQRQKTAAVHPSQNPFVCHLSHWTHLGDYIAILEYSFACTGRKAVHWKPKKHMVELGSHFEIPELNNLGRKKRVAIVSQRYIVELSNASLPYLPFWKSLARLAKDPTTIATVAPFAKPIQTSVDAFPEDVSRIICGKAVLSNTDKDYPEVRGLCVLEFELVTPPAVYSPTHSPTSSLPNSSSSSSSSTNSQSPPPSLTRLEWKANFSYSLDVSSADQVYNPVSATGDPKVQHTLTLNLGIDDNINPAQSFFALQQPRVHYNDTSVFAMNSVEQPTGCCHFQGLPVTRHDLSKRHKLIFKNVKYNRHVQKSARSARVKATPPPNRPVPRPILAAISPPTSITPAILATVRNSDSSSSSSSASGSPSSSYASWSPSSVSSNKLASSLSASSGASASGSPSPPPPRSPARRRRRRRGRSPSSSSSSGESPTASRDVKFRFYCPRPKCGRFVHSNKALHAHILYIHGEPSMHKCTYPGCESAYPRKGNLMTHIKSTHKKDELKKCEKCGEALSREYNTVRHEETCTGVADGRSKRKRRLSE